jgi:hypothetical protein
MDFEKGPADRPHRGLRGDSRAGEGELLPLGAVYQALEMASWKE